MKSIIPRILITLWLATSQVFGAAGDIRVQQRNPGNTAWQNVDMTTANGGVLKTNASGVPSVLSPGTNGYVLTMSGGLPVWSGTFAPTSLIVDGTFSGTPTSGTLNLAALRLKLPYGAVDVTYYGAVGDGVTDDTAAIIAALAASNYVTISRAGTYMVSAPIYLSTGQTLEGATGVTLKKSTTYSHILVNDAAATTGTTWDTGITIRNLILDDNNTGTQTGAAAVTANGILQFKYITSSTIENTSIINGDTTLFGYHLQSVSQISMRSVSYTGSKDGIHIGGGSSNVDIDGFYIDSFDDSIAVMTEDYPRVQANASDIYNVTIRNGVTNSTTSPAGAGGIPATATGSWLAWANGNTYRIGDCANNAGKIYKMVNSGSFTGTVAPVQTSGDVTGADGITWRFLQTGVNTTTNIYNLVVENITAKDGRGFTFYKNNDAFDHSEYPGTENTTGVRGMSVINPSWIVAAQPSPIFTAGTNYWNNVTLLGLRGSPARYDDGLTTATVFLSTGSGNIFQAIDTSTTAKYTDVRTNGAAYYLGAESLAGGSLFSGGSSYSTVFGTTGTTSLQFASNGIVRQTIASDGQGYFTGNVNFASSISSTGTGPMHQSTAATTASKYFDIRNTSGGQYFGLESSAGNTLFSGANGYSSVFGSTTATPLHLATNGTVRFTISSTGQITTTSDATVGGALGVSSALAASDISTAAFTTAGGIGVAKTSYFGDVVNLLSTLSFSNPGGLVAATGASTSAKYFDIRNTGAGFYLGVESSAGGTLFTGASAYATVVGTQGATSFQLATNGVVRQTITSAGAATYTGAVSVSNTTATITSGTGTPEGAVTAPVGSIFLRTNGGAGTTFYVKESGVGNTGWVAK